MKDEAMTFPTRMKTITQPVALIFLIGTASVVMLDSAAASTIRHDQPDADYLNLALDPQYASVGTFVNNQSFNGSAILIAPDWVLTGAHLFRFASSGTFTINGNSYASDQLITHPDWNSANVWAGYDFGLVHLSTPVVGVTPATLYTGSSEVGQVGTFVGFGMTGTGVTGYQTLDNQARAFENMIDGNFGNPEILLASDFDNPLSAADSDFGSPFPLTLEGAVAPGDSGGGVFITVDSATYLAGVISFIASSDGLSNADYGDVMGFGRVSAIVPWISGFVAVPEPSSTCLFVSGLALLVWRRSRRT